MVVKPVVGGSSVGMSIVKTEAEFLPAVDLAFGEDNTVMLEAYIEGIELTCGVIGNRQLEALPLIEIFPDETHTLFDYEAKYTAGATQEICPARIDETITRTAQTYAKLAHQTLYCRGYSRTDMILNDQKVYVLETNTIPGMTATSLLPQAAKAAGMNFDQLLDRLIELSIEDR
jgi:D-alanine-D-alanine ligase